MTQMVVNFVRQPIVEQLDWTLLHFLWQATAVAFLVATVLRSIRTAAATWRYTTACLGLLLLAVTPVVTFFMVEGRADSNAVTNTPREINEGIVADADEALTSLLAQDGAVSATTGPGTDSVTGITLTNLPPDWSTAEDSNSDAEVLSQQNDRGRGSALPSVSESPDWQVRVRSSLPWVVACWVVGVLLLSLWHAAGWLFAKRLTVQGTCPVPVAVQSAFQELVERMQIRRRVQLLQSARARVPVVIGWLKPVLLMPAGVLSGLSGDQLQAILAHELAHVRRHDYLVNLLQTIVETFLFYHPAVWWLSRRIRIEREFCADDEAAGVCQDRESYARALLCLADAVAAVPATAVAASGGSLTERVYRLLGVTVQPHRVSRRSPWFASAGIAVAVFCGLVFSSPSPARQIDEKPPKPTPIQEVAEQLGGSIPGWNLLDFDREPSVAVAGFGGYRVVLRRKWKQYTNPPQQQAARAAPGEGGREPPFEWRTVDWEFVLIPNQPEPAPAALKSRMNWTKSRSPYHTRDLCLGDGFGYTWFTHGTLFNQEDLRETLKLTGGDDRIQLIVEAITLRDKNSHTSNSCMQLVSRFGDRSLPYIRRAAERALEDQQELDLWRISGSLAFVRSDRATATILQLYDFGNPQVRSGAEYALVHKPFRPKAKRAYLDMVRRRSRISEAAAACVEFEWREAIPFLRAAIDRPDSLFVLRDALRACRTLEGNPVSAELIAAERLLMTNRDGDDPATQKKIDDAIRLLIDSKDAEAADTSALMLAMRIGKGSFAWVNDRGLAILRSRPREATLAFITRIRAGMPRYQQERLNKVLKNITGRNQAAAPRTIGQPRANPFAPSTVPLGADLPPDPFQRRRVITPTMVGVPGTGWQIATTPVTNAQYGQFLEATNRKWPVVADLPDTDGRDRGYPWKHLLGSADGFAEGRGNHPVALVSREEALAYCRWLGSRIGGEFTLAPNEVYAAAVRGSRGVSVGRDEMKRLGRAETLDGTNRMWFPLARVDAYPQYQSDLKVLVQGQSFYELTKKGLSQPNAWWADSSRPFLFEQHGPANRLCVVGFRVARDMDRRANTAPGDTTWVNAVSEPSDRGTQHFAYQKVRDRRTRNEDQFRHWRMWHRDDIRELDEQFDAAGKVRVSYSPRDENLLMFRSRQLNDLDRIWIERVERDGKQFTITAHRAIWGGVYTRNISYFDVFAVRIGKLPAGDYRAKLIIKPLTFMKYDENRWPIGERPSRAERPTELNVDFRIAGLTIPGEGFPGRPDDPAPVVPSAPDLAPTVPRGQPRAAIKSARPAPAWGKAVNGLQAGLICDAPPEGFEPGHVRVGEFLSVQLTVKNVSNRMISFTTVAPSFRVPDLHDLTGRKMKIMIPPWDGPASFATHRLKPGESTTLPVRRCTIAPRVPIYNADGYHIYAGVGHFDLSAPVRLDSHRKGDWSGSLRTGTIRLRVISPDQKKVTQRVADELTRRVDNLACKVVYLGERSERRSVALLSGASHERFPETWTVATIDRAAAKSIINFLAINGHLWRCVCVPDAEWFFPQVSYMVAINTGPPGTRHLLIPLKWSEMADQIRGLRSAVDGEASTALRELLEQPLLKDWHHLDGGNLVGVSVQPMLYERPGHPHFYLRFRVTNRTKSDVHVDLENYDRVFHPNQWGFHPSRRRIVVDEARMEPDLLTPRLIESLTRRAQAKELTRIPPGQTIDYFREFNRGGRATVEAQQKEEHFLIVSIDGQLLATDGTKTENVNVWWNRYWDDSDAHSDVVIPAPVSFARIPAGARIVEP